MAAARLAAVPAVACHPALAADADNVGTAPAYPPCRTRPSSPRQRSASCSTFAYPSPQPPLLCGAVATVEVALALVAPVFCCLLLLLCSLCWVGWRHNQRTCPQCHLLCRLRCRLRILLLASITSTIYPFLCHKNHRYSAIRRVLTTLYLDLMRKRRWCWGGQQR